MKNYSKINQKPSYISMNLQLHCKFLNSRKLLTFKFYIEIKLNIPNKPQQTRKLRCSYNLSQSAFQSAAIAIIFLLKLNFPLTQITKTGSYSKDVVIKSCHCNYALEDCFSTPLHLAESFFSPFLVLSAESP